MFDFQQLLGTLILRQDLKTLESYHGRCKVHKVMQKNKNKTQHTQYKLYTQVYTVESVYLQ